MRVAVFVVLVLVASTPSEASKSCMTRTDARQHFGSVHIYWHGEGHCWDATPIRRYHQTHKVQKIRNVQRTIDQQAGADVGRRVDGAFRHAGLRWI